MKNNNTKTVLKACLENVAEELNDMAFELFMTDKIDPEQHKKLNNIIRQMIDLSEELGKEIDDNEE